MSPSSSMPYAGPTEDALRSAARALEDLAGFLSDVSAADYQRPSAIVAGSTLGQHVRHCLNHFESLLAGLPLGFVDYDARNRDLELECDRNCAIARCRVLADDMLASLRSLPAAAPVLVRIASDLEGEVPPQRSSLGRELLFVQSHTVHHFALLCAIAREHGLKVPADFGVAPSTLRHRRGD
ncbi:MAG: DinB family protein [Planctomycetota bacterium]